MSEAPAIFDSHADRYDAQRRALIPCFDAFYGAAVRALDFAAGPLRRILDLGAGTGLFARAVLAAHADVRLTLLDGAPAMLARARDALGEDANYVTADLAGPLPSGPWDAVVSALAIHHLEDADKRTLFARVHAELAPGGVFVNAEHVRGPTAAFDDAYVRWHEREATALGVTEAQWADARERMRADRLATVSDQLAWLRDSGFDADCLFKDHGLAVVVALKAR